MTTDIRPYFGFSLPLTISLHLYCRKGELRSISYPETEVNRFLIKDKGTPTSKRTTFLELKMPKMLYSLRCRTSPMARSLFLVQAKLQVRLTRIQLVKGLQNGKLSQKETVL